MKTKICWKKEAPIGILGIWCIYYGWNNTFGTGIVRSKISFALSIQGYWIGIAHY